MKQKYLALEQMRLVVEAMEVDNVMTVGVPGGDAITSDIRYLASCGSNVQLLLHSIKNCFSEGEN